MKLWPWLGTGLLGLGLISCQGGERSPVEPRPVVVTSTILGDLVETVAGDRVVVQTLLTPGDDPHLYEPVPRDTAQLEQATVIFYNGLNLEPGLIRLIEGVGTGAVRVPLGEGVPVVLQEDNRVPDPHVWGNVTNAIAMVETIRATLGEAFPAEAAHFDRNAAALTADLTALHTWIQTQIDTIPPNQRRLVTTHDAFQYYTEAYGLTVLGTLIGISTEEQPSAQTVRDLVQAIRAAQVPAIFVETTLNPALMTTVAEEAGVILAEPPLYSDALGEPGSGADTYATMMATNTQTIVLALGGRILSPAPLPSGPETQSFLPLSPWPPSDTEELPRLRAIAEDPSPFGGSISL